MKTLMIILLSVPFLGAIVTISSADKPPMTNEQKTKMSEIRRERRAARRQQSRRTSSPKKQQPSPVKAAVATPMASQVATQTQLPGASVQDQRIAAQDEKIRRQRVMIQLLEARIQKEREDRKREIRETDEQVQEQALENMALWQGLHGEAYEGLRTWRTEYQNAQEDLRVARNEIRLMDEQYAALDEDYQDRTQRIAIMLPPVVNAHNQAVQRAATLEQENSLLRQLVFFTNHAH